MKLQLKKYGILKIFVCTTSICLVPSLFVINEIKDKSFAKSPITDQKKVSVKGEHIIQPLPDYHQIATWREALYITHRYHSEFSNFHQQTNRVLSPIHHPWGTLKSDNQNEDALIYLIGRINSQEYSRHASLALLDKINQKEVHRVTGKLSLKLFCLDDFPAYDALVQIEPTAAFAAKERIGKEPNQEKRRLMAKLLCKVLGKKFALLYLEDENLKVAANEKLSTDKKETYQARYREAIDQVSKKDSK